MVTYSENKKYNNVKNDVKTIPTIIRLLEGGNIS
jgi:hypothetical protein